MAFFRPHIGDNRTCSRSAYGLPRLHQAVNAVVLQLLQPQVGSGHRLPYRLRLRARYGCVYQGVDKGWKIELPPQPRHDPNEDGWDVGSIVQYWSTQPDNDELDTIELGYKALTLYAVSVYPRVSDLARLARDKLDFLATSMRFSYFGTKELWLVPIFNRQTGIPRVDHLRVCPVLAMKAYVDHTSTRQYIHPDLVHPFEHVFMPQVPKRLLVFTSRLALRHVLGGSIPS